MNALYQYRDHYFETRGVENARDKSSDLDKTLKETLKTLDKLQCGYPSFIENMDCLCIFSKKLIQKITK